MDTEQVTNWISKASAGTITRGVLWAIGGISAYLTIKGFIVPDVDTTKVQEIVQIILTIALPILASKWSKQKDVKLLNAEIN